MEVWLGDLHVTYSYIGSIKLSSSKSMLFLYSINCKWAVTFNFPPLISF